MSTNRTLRAVPTPAIAPAKPRTETEEKLWQALRNNPGSTATALSADGGSRPADRWSITTDNQPADDQPTDDRAGKPQRLAPGALRGVVEAYLRDNSGEFSPNAIGMALDRSSGAVHNALEKLVESGYAVRTSDKPKKYSLVATTAATTE